MNGLNSGAGLERLRRNWDEFGRRSPVWAIDSSLPTADWGEFFLSGEVAVLKLFERLAPLGISASGRAALDFGCGAGRLTQALARRFNHVVGVDVADSMIVLAEKFNAYPDRCEYALNVATDLSRFPDGSFDFCCSLLVLQHMENALAEGYVSEIVRVLGPGGVAVFQAPTRPIPPAPLGGANPYRATIKRAEASTSAGSADDEAAVEARRRLPSRDPIVVGDQGPHSLALRVIVKNESTTTWAPEHQVRLGKRWLSARGTVLEPEDDGARAVLPDTVEPSSQVIVAMQVSAPESPGDYLLELDLVQEGVTWFRDHGSPTLVLPVKVVGELPGSSHEGPYMEMKGLPRERVVQAIEGAGGRLVAALADDSAGADWESLLYVVRR